MQGTTVTQRLSWQPVSRPALARLLLIVFAALALFLQAYAAQTHFHQQASAVSAQQVAAQTGKHHQPVSDDSDSCPLCHSFYSGQYVTPSLAAWFLPILAVSIIDVTTGVSPHYDTVSHSWRGRGPPSI
ncbi:MAG TPA: hypothetical protein VGH23_10245 [Rhizomicrobium sp.]|jgi:hypothetical protein